MKKLMSGKGRWLAAGALATCLVAGLAACAPASNDKDKGASTPETVAMAEESNDTVVFGDLDRYDPNQTQAHDVGESMGVDEETQLQQEKTAGFSGGAVVSNLEELPAGITGYSESEPAGMNATTGEPKVVPHGNGNGADCLSCHATGEQQVPDTHVANSIANEQCTSCHVVE